MRESGILMPLFSIPSKYGIGSLGDEAYRFVDIPDGVKTIGYGAFYHCADLENVVIPDSVEFIDAKAFEKTKWLENWYNSDEDDYLIVGDGILLAYKGDKSDFVLPNYVKSVSCDIEWKIL